MTTKVVIVNSGSTLSVPADYDDSSALLYAIGAGGDGGASTNSTNSGGGGGGGECRSLASPGLTASGTYDVMVGTHGGGNSNTAGGGNTWVKGTNGGGGSIILCAISGLSGSGTTGGLGGGQVGNTTNGVGTVSGKGGTGGAGRAAGTSRSGGSGGGAGGTSDGAAGLIGSNVNNTGGSGGSGANAGAIGSANSGTTGGNGGNGPGGTGGGTGGAAQTSGGNATSGTGAGGGGSGANFAAGVHGGNGAQQDLWTDNSGGVNNGVVAGPSGGGGSGGGHSNTSNDGYPGGNGGTYGGGGGGAGSSTKATGGGAASTGGQGLIVLTYTPGGGVTTGVTIATSYAVDRIIQRDAGATTKALTLAGTYTGAAPSSLNYDITIVAGGSAGTGSLSSFTAGGGTWSGSLTVPQGSWYKIKVTEPNSGVNNTQANEFGVGICVALIGQSNMLYMDQVGSIVGYPVNANCRAFNNHTQGWVAMNIRADNGSVGSGAGILTLSDTIQKGLGGTVPVGFFVYAVGGTSVHTDWQSGQTSWLAFTDTTDGIKCSAAGGDFEFVLWHQGEADSKTASTPQGYYASDLATIVSNCQTLVSRNTSTLHFGVAELGATWDSTWGSDANMDFVRNCHYQQAKAAGCFFAGVTYDNVNNPANTPHWLNVEYASAGYRYANAVLNQLGINASGSIGPMLTAASWPVGSATITCTFTQNSGGTGLLDGSGSSAGTGLIGFVVTASGGAASVTATSISGNTVLLTMGRNRGAGETVTITYGAGSNPWGWTGTGDTNAHVLYDNRASYTLDTYGFPAQPTAASNNNAALTVSAGVSATPHYYDLVAVGRLMSR